MAYVLMWLEALAFSLLLPATVMAWTGRFRRVGLGRAAVAGASALPLLIVGLLTIVCGYVRFAHNVAPSLFFPLLALTVAYMVGITWLHRSGRRAAAGADGRPASASWPAGRLAVATGVAAVLGVMTFSNADLAARQQLAVLRAEAGAMATSVAPTKPPDRDNAALTYGQAFEAIGPRDQMPEAWDERWRDYLDGDAAFDANDVELRRFLDRHEPTLAMLRRAAGKAGCHFEHDYQNISWDMVIDEFGNMRRAGKLVALHARSRLAGGDVVGAMEDVDTMFAMADHIGSGSMLIGVLMAYVIDYYAFGTLELAVAGGKVTAEAAASVRIDSTVSYRRMLERAYRMEEAARLATFCMMDGREAGSAPEPTGLGLPRDALALYRVFLLSEDLASHYRLSAEGRRLAAMPYHKARDGFDWSEEQLAGGPMGLLTRMLFPALSAVSERGARGDAHRGLIRLALAAVRYRAKHGRFPAEPAELAPEFILAIPRDPYDGKVMRLKRTDSGIVFYSIGPDTVDDGASPFNDKEKTGDVTFTVPEGADR